MPEEYRCAPFVELQLVHDWAGTIARHWLYETADSIRVAALMESDWPELAGLAAKMDREEAYHRMHARDVGASKLATGRSASSAAVAELWPYALGRPRARAARASRAQRVGRERGRGGRARRPRDEGFAALHEEMTMVRRSVPGAAW